jgi:hypothetical protein
VDAPLRNLLGDNYRKIMDARRAQDLDASWGSDIRMRNSSRKPIGPPKKYRPELYCLVELVWWQTRTILFGFDGNNALLIIMIEEVSNR